MAHNVPRVADVPRKPLKIKLTIAVFFPYFFLNNTFIPADLQKWILPWASSSVSELNNVQVHYFTDVIGSVYPQKYFLKESIKNVLM